MAHYKGAAAESIRALQLANKRKQQQDEMEHKKRKIEEKLKIDIDKRFSSQSNESQANDQMIGGLFTMAEMKAKQEEMQQALLKNENHKTNKDTVKATERYRHQKQISKLSFDFNDDDEEDDFDNRQQQRIKKNLDVDTSFLPDRKREEMEYKMREQLKVEWIEKQDALKAEEIEVTFSYWDGCGHRFAITMKKGNSIYEFLQQVLTQILRKEFPELRVASADQLMFIKEDLILPSYYTFYDFIISEARGKSGPLFQFDVKDDIRLVADATIEKQESHAGKVLLRSWYERNKHIFPASRWEPFDPLKTYSTYSYKDKKI